MRNEIDDMTSVLMGRSEPPVQAQRTDSLYEVANAYYSRGMELTMILQRLEADGVVMRGTKMYKFRTGELRTFVELAQRAAELGSRRISVAEMEYKQRYG